MTTVKEKKNASVSYLASILRNLSRQAEPIVENTASANRELERIKDVFSSEWYFALADFDQKVGGSGASLSDIDMSRAVSELQSKWGDSLSSAMSRSFRKGYGSRGRQDSSSLTYDRIVDGSPLFKRILDKHTAFANQFAQEYASGSTNRRGAMGVGPRSNMYAQALRGAFNAGAVFGGINDDKIYWRLGATEHCADCIAIAASGPYTIDTLPTVPGNGDTICKTNCACHLVFVRGAKRLEPEDTLQSWLNAGDEGAVEESEEQDDVRKLQDLMLQRSFLRRVSLGTDNITAPDIERSNSAAKAISRQIDQMSSDLSLSAAARYNPASVITRADISERDLEQIFVAGIDGPSIFRADIDGALSEIDEVARRFDSMPERTTKIPKLPQEEGRLPRVGAFGTYNIVADGAARTFMALRKLVEVLGSTEIFIELGAADDSLERVVGFSGIWIRGQKDETETAIALLQESGLDVAVGEVMFL